MVPLENELAVLDGVLMPVEDAVIPVTDPGLLRGDGVFEALRVYAGRQFGLEQHLQRLVRSADGMLLEIDISQVARDVEQLMEACGETDYEIRIVLTRGGHRLVVSEQIPDFAESVALATVEYRTTVVLNGLKTLSYGGNMQANRLAARSGADEALLVTPEGRVLEAPTASFFFSPDGETLVTPELSGDILASITRATLLESVEVVERAVTRDELGGASEAFLCASIREVQPVSSIDGAALPAPGPLTLVAQQAYRQAVEARVTASRANND